MLLLTFRTGYSLLVSTNALSCRLSQTTQCTTLVYAVVSKRISFGGSSDTTVQVKNPLEPISFSVVVVVGIVSINMYRVLFLLFRPKND